MEVGGDAVGTPFRSPYLANIPTPASLRVAVNDSAATCYGKLPSPKWLSPASPR